MIKIIVDDKEIEAEDGSNLLQTCLDNGIFIPNLCYLKEMDRPAASCRLCFVEVDGMNVASCAAKIRDGMIVRTDAEQVRRLQKTAFELIMS
ncbi:(2Fe-2S)-binding protein, partial [Patescibacteria group bacterium]|nr:(2Fe-2S)-binding protein [Patescibacteria group bacterium]